jgi:hypothetical protein
MPPFACGATANCDDGAIWLVEDRTVIRLDTTSDPADPLPCFSRFYRPADLYLTANAPMRTATTFSKYF